MSSQHQRRVIGIMGLVVALLLVIAFLPILIGCLKREHHLASRMLTEVNNCLEEGRLDEALEKANVLVEQFGNDSIYGFMIYKKRATIYAMRGEVDCAIRDLTAAIDREDSELGQLFDTIRRGRCKEHLGFMQEAADDYQHAYEGYISLRDRDALPPCGYMAVIDFFWTVRHDTDEAFGFDKLEFDRTGSYRETKRARREAALNWMLRFIDVHEKIVDNIGDVDAKVISLDSKTQERTD